MKINPHTYRIMLLHGFKMCGNIISCFKFYKMILWDGVTVFVIFAKHYNEIFCSRFITNTPPNTLLQLQSVWPCF